MNKRDICKRIDEAIKDEKEGVEFYDKLKNDMIDMHLESHKRPEDRINWFGASDAVLHIKFQEEKHLNRLEEIRSNLSCR